MATEHIVDLENQRYADRPFDGPAPVVAWDSLREREMHQANALNLLKLRLHSGPDQLDRADLRNILQALGLDG